MGGSLIFTKSRQHILLEILLTILNLQRSFNGIFISGYQPKYSVLNLALEIQSSKKTGIVPFSEHAVHPPPFLLGGWGVGGLSLRTNFQQKGGAWQDLNF